MPIRINLLAEAQAAEEARRKDPVKRVGIIGALLVLAVIVYSALLQFRVMNAGSTSAGIEGRWRSIEKDYQAITRDVAKAIELQQKLKALDRLSTNRFLWGTVLDSLQQTTVDGVQLVRLRADQVYTQTDAVPPKPTATPPQAGKPASSVEKISLILEARDYGNPNEQNYNRFKAAIQNFPFFRQYFTKQDSVKLTSLSPPAEDPVKGGNFVQFTLECQFPEVVRNE